MNIYTVNENAMLSSIIAYLENDNKNHLSAILKISKFTYNPQWEFSNVIPNQKKLYGTLRVPLKFKKIIQDELNYISSISCELYEDDDDYYFLGINNVNMLAIQIEELEYNNKYVMIEKDSVFSEFIKFIIISKEVDPLQKKYLFEACECGNRNNLLSASVMLGASAEMLLIDFCMAYKNYLAKNADNVVVSAFENKVINARCAHIRLTEFLKRANSNAQLFNTLGFSDLNLNFSFFDIVRQTRNDSGHPTGNTITMEEFKILIGNYIHFIPKINLAITQLNTI